MLKYPYTIISIYRSLSITLFHHQSLSVFHTTHSTLSPVHSTVSLCQLHSRITHSSNLCAHYTHICHSLSIALFLVCCSLRKVVVILRCPASWSSKSKTSMLVGKKVDILKVRAPHLIQYQGRKTRSRLLSIVMLLFIVVFQIQCARIHKKI